MKVTPLSGEEQRNTWGCTHLVEIFHTDLIPTAGLTVTLPIAPRSGTFPANTAVGRVMGLLKVPFVGCTTLVIDIGDIGTGASPNRFVAAQSLIAGAASSFISVNTTPQLYNAPAADNALVIKLTATVNNLNLLTAGVLKLWIAVLDINRA